MTKENMGTENFPRGSLGREFSFKNVTMFKFADAIY